MLDTPDLARFVAALYEKSARWHRTAIAFGAGTLLEYVARAEKLDAGVMAFLLPAILAPLKGTREGIVSPHWICTQNRSVKSTARELRAPRGALTKMPAHAARAAHDTHLHGWCGERSEPQAVRERRGRRLRASGAVGHAAA